MELHQVHPVPISISTSVPTYLVYSTYIGSTWVPNHIRYIRWLFIVLLTFSCLLAVVVVVVLLRQQSSEQGRST
ncbi:hypothetical protein GGR58DRAFT_360456 [Xylaria digitata]|nr:hypothetical protein GGR58DRAFT_360456 [Xylaria digitata]